jgi:hypothetical protein
VQLAKVKGQLAELMNNPQSLLLEALHTVGFQGGLAKPLVTPESSLSLITADSLAQFVQVHVSLITMLKLYPGVCVHVYLYVFNSLLSLISDNLLALFVEVIVLKVLKIIICQDLPSMEIFYVHGLCVAM